jgi:hypothetical protein
VQYGCWHGGSSQNVGLHITVSEHGPPKPAPTCIPVVGIGTGASDVFNSVVSEGQVVAHLVIPSQQVSPSMQYTLPQRGGNLHMPSVKYGCWHGGSSQDVGLHIIVSEPGCPKPAPNWSIV